MTQGLLDGDMYAFRCAASAEQEPEEIAILRLDGMLRESLSKVDNYKLPLSGPNNFRYKIYPDYKANRKGKPKPIHLAACQQFLIEEYGAFFTDGCEADDFLGYSQIEDSIVFCNDKDLLMIPGFHYNPVTGVYKEISELDGLKQFYRQLLIGDTADNVKGVDGIGKVKAAKLIDHLETEYEMYRVVKDLYYPVLDCKLLADEERFEVNCDLLWIWRNLNERFSDRKWQTKS